MNQGRNTERYPTAQTDSARANPEGFTLVELLVVVAIIALLLGILLPALGKAREVARSAACMANLRGAGIGVSVYQTEWDGWLAGPNTSGLALNDNSHTWSSNPTEPVQNMDWMSPTLGNELGLPGDRDERLVEMFNTALRCAANDKTYDDFYSGSGSGEQINLTANEIKQLSVNSYSAPALFHFYKPGRGPTNALTTSVYSLDSFLQLPDGYAPRIFEIGNPSGKVAALDGVRYYNSGSGKMSFNPFTKQIQGGNYMTWGPPYSQQIGGDPHKWNISRNELETYAVEYAYRHPGQSLNLAFFDGHAENAAPEDSFNPDWYMPRGSKLPYGTSMTTPGQPGRVDGGYVIP